MVPGPYSGEEDHEFDKTHTGTKEKDNSDQSYGDAPYESNENHDEGGEPPSKDEERHTVTSPTTVWIRCDVYDTGIGIPGKPLYFFSYSLNCFTAFTKVLSIYTMLLKQKPVKLTSLSKFPPKRVGFPPKVLLNASNFNN